MKNMHVVLASLAAGASLGASSLSLTQAPDWRPWLDAQTAGFSGVALVGRDDAIEVQAAYGLAGPAGRPNTADTRFNIGSINKTFTAVAVAQLIQQGRLSLDDTLARRLPEYPNHAAAARITLRDLLTHRSGIAQFMGADFGEGSLSDVVQKIGAEPQAFEPGAEQQYSNGGYAVLGRVVEVVSGESYDTYVAAHIYKPAGMTATGSFHPGDGPDTVALPVASSGGRGGAGTAADTPGLRMRGPGMMLSGPRPGNPAGGGYSTAADLFRFSRALRGGRLLDARMTEYVLNGTFAGQPKFGFSLREQIAGARRFVGNGGGAPGVNAEFRFEPAGPYTVVVLANSGPPAATDLLTAILNRIAGQPATAGTLRSTDARPR